MIDAPVSDAPRQKLAPLPNADPTMSELISGIADDAQLLIRQQYQMLRAEICEDVRRTKSAVKYLGLGTGGVAFGMLFLMVAMSQFLNWVFGFPLFAGWAIIGGIVLLLGGIALFVGNRIFERNNPLPDKTLNALEENLAWIMKRRN